MIFKKNYTTRWHDTAADRTVRPTQILVFMQETSNHHIKSLGTDLDILHERDGLGFILSKTRLALYKPLYAFEDITVETFTVPSRGFSFNRFFRITRGDEVIAAADTTWALVSLKTKAGLKRCGASKNGEWHFEVLKFRGPDSGIWLSCCAIYG